MPIAHSAFSYASAWKSYQPRETLRSHGGEEGWHPSDSKGMSPTKVNSIRPRYANRQRPTSRRWGSLKSMRKQCAYALFELTGVIGEGAFRKVNSMSRETHTGALTVKVQTEQWMEGNHNFHSSQNWESEWFVVAKKRGNARGAKRPYFSHVSIKIRKAA